MKSTANLCYFISIFAVDFIFLFVNQNIMKRKIYSGYVKPNP